MPEVVEICLFSHYLITYVKNKYITNVDITGGRYNKGIPNVDVLINAFPLKIINIDTKGKLMWFELLNEKTNEIFILLNTFGLTGIWTFDKLKYSDISFKIDNKINLYFDDQLHYGTFKITDKDGLKKKLNELGDDLLKTEFTNSDFLKKVQSIKNKNYKIINVLMNQKKNGLGSGLGNYLTAEILYHSKISPHRKIIDLSHEDILFLSQTIKYILKLCYLTNNIGYMTLFDDYIELHKKQIKKNIFPNYHNDIELEKNDIFKFYVYRQPNDPYGNNVKKEKIMGERNFYWVENVQK